MRSRSAVYTFLFLTFTLHTPAGIAQDEDLFPGGRYDQSIPTPSEITGHRFGERHTFHWEMEDFIQAVDEASDRVEARCYGKTYQGRRLYTVIISDPENMRRLEEIRKANLRLTDPRSISQEEVNDIARWMPSIVWLGYNIHGNEASAMEAAIQTVYQLAAGIDEATLQILKNVVTIIDPVQNPDGHDRYVQRIRSIVSLESHPNPIDVEHRSPWPGGRSNHYLFDLNRDFFLKTQIESRQKAAVYHEWMPHVFADLHEMGSNATYFFPPPMTPYNEYVKPMLMKWWKIIANANAKAFDHFGWGYYTKESFDAFYPGYGTSYPSINGAVGMTFEQASARSVSTERDDGSVLTLREAAWHHFTTSTTTLRAVSGRKEEKIRDFHAFFASSLREAREDPMKEIFLVPRDPHITAKLIGNLLQEGVEIIRATASFSIPRAVSYFEKTRTSKTFPEGTYIIRLDQPQKTLIKALLAPESPLGDAFLEEEKERRENLERSHFYDITAWSMPLTYGIDAYWTGKTSGVEGEPVTHQPSLHGTVIDGPATQAYLIPFETLASSKLLIRLMAEDYRVRIARKRFVLSGTTWPKGTLVVRVNRNPDSLHERIGELADEFGVDITAVHHGLADAGIDLGSGNIVTLRKPNVALLTESPVSAYSYGAIHYLFEREYDLPFIRIDVRNMADLNTFNVLVMPSGNYRESFSGEGLRRLKDWIRSGGTVVAVAGATSSLSEDTLKLSAAKRLERMTDPDDGTRYRRPERTPGAIVRVNLNPRSFLSYGCTEAVAVLVRSNQIYLPFEDDQEKNIGLYAPLDKMRLSGFIWPETESALPGKGWLFLEPYGRGKLILFTEDPNFRASYDGLNKLFLNAILLGPSLRR